MSDGNGREPNPKIGRAIQDQIGRELRAMYEELLRQPLPEHLVAPLRASSDVPAAAGPSSEDVGQKGGTTTPRRTKPTRSPRLPPVKEA
jgi:Anti-sigma factor NepR